MVTFKARKRDRKLEFRSHLSVEFPQKNNRVFRTFIPFLENPTITENGESTLNEYNLIGRAGSLFSYGGSRSRAFTLNFNISLMHMLHMNYFEGIDAKFRRAFSAFFADAERDKESFNLGPEGQSIAKQRGEAAAAQALSNPLLQTNTASMLAQQATDLGNAAAESKAQGFADLEKDRTEGFEKNPKGKPHANIHRQYFRGLVGQAIGGTPAFDTIANTLIGGINQIPNIFSDTKGALIQSSQEQQTELDDLIDLVYVWLNLIRGTTLNNSTDTTLGPPIVRLTHGPMYNNVPCVVENYNISISEDAGYDVETLTPKQIQVSMSLREFRTGNFGEFSAGAHQLGDNLAGWEAIIGDNNLDPYNGEIGRDSYGADDVEGWSLEAIT